MLLRGNSLQTIKGVLELHAASWLTNEWLSVAKNYDLVHYERWGSVNPSRFLKAFPLDDFKDLQLRRLEARSFVIDEVSRHTRRVVSAALLVDLKGFSISHRKLMPYFGECLREGSTVVPGLRGSVFVVGSVKAVTLYALVGPRLDDNVDDSSRVVRLLHGGDPFTTSEDFKHMFEHHSVPTVLGGFLKSGPSQDCCTGIALGPALDNKWLVAAHFDALSSNTGAGSFKMKKPTSCDIMSNSSASQMQRDMQSPSFKRRATASFTGSGKHMAVPGPLSPGTSPSRGGRRSTAIVAPSPDVAAPRVF